jgi:hypothetical protein
MQGIDWLYSQGFRAKIVVSSRMSYQAGIYSIYCTENEKQYIGSSKDIAQRWRDHRYELRNNKHGCYHLQNAWNKYGERCVCVQCD